MKSGNLCFTNVACIWWRDECRIDQFVSNQCQYCVDFCVFLILSKPLACSSEFPTEPTRASSVRVLAFRRSPQWCRCPTSTWGRANNNQRGKFAQVAAWCLEAICGAAASPRSGGKRWGRLKRDEKQSNSHSFHPDVPSMPCRAAPCTTFQEDIKRQAWVPFLFLPSLRQIPAYKMNAYTAALSVAPPGCCLFNGRLQHSPRRRFTCMTEGL